MCALSKFVIYHWMWEQLWHRAVCINEEQDRKRHPSDIYPSSCLAACLWHCEMERKAWSKMRCKHVCSMNSCFGMELFEDERTFFLSAFTMYVITLKKTHSSPPHFLSLAAFFSFFFPLHWPSGFQSRKKPAPFVKSTERLVGKESKGFL